jgi:hypothetical protein
MTANITKLVARIGEGDDATVKTFHGRAAWALGALLSSGADGCTPITRPAPRWSHYVYLLKRDGLNVETILQPHGGAYAGRHAKYVLRSPVQVLEIEEAGVSQ